MVGNPYKFSIITREVSDWNYDDTFWNGVMLFCIDGQLFPKEIYTAALKAEINFLKSNLMELVIDDFLYQMPKDEAYACIYNKVHPLDYDMDPDYRFDISPQVFGDHHCIVFAVSDGTNIRVMAAMLEYDKAESRHNLSAIDISEAFITLDELNKMIEDITVR